MNVITEMTPEEQCKYMDIKIKIMDNFIDNLLKEKIERQDKEDKGQNFIYYKDLK